MIIIFNLNKAFFLAKSKPPFKKNVHLFIISSNFSSQTHFSFYTKYVEIKKKLSTFGLTRKQPNFSRPLFNSFTTVRTYLSRLFIFKKIVVKGLVKCRKSERKIREPISHTLTSVSTHFKIHVVPSIIVDLTSAEDTVDDEFDNDDNEDSNDNNGE